MTRTLVTFFLLVMLAMSLATTQASARIRTLTADECRGTVHPVMYGETVEQLIGPVFRPNSRWPAFVRANEGVKDRFFIRRDGTLIVKLYPSRGDTICIPPETRVVGDIVATEPYELTATGSAYPANPQTTPEAAGTSWTIPQWVGWAALGLLALVLLTIYRLRRGRLQPDEEVLIEDELSKDPITSGTPYVAGGIKPTETDRLANQMDSLAIAQYVIRNPQTSIVQVDRIGPIESGLIHGVGLVGYLGPRGYFSGEDKPRRIEEPGIQAYRAKYRFPDGSEDYLMALQGCMNPVTNGGETYKGFTFVPDKASDELCRGRYVGLDRENTVAEQEADFFGESMATVTEHTIVNAVGQVDEHSLRQGGGHRVSRFHKQPNGEWY